MNGSFLKDSPLQLQNKALKKKLESFENGEAYVKIRRQYESMLTQEERENKKLKEELAHAHAQAVTMRNRWFEVFEGIQREAESNDRKKNTQIKKLKKRIWELEKKLEETSRILQEKDAVIRELTNKPAHAEALLGHDGTNTGISTAQTPVDKKKVIPNSRRSTGKKKGGQPGHERHVLMPPAGDEVDVIIAHEAGAEDCCPRCGGQDFVFTGRCEVKYETDIRIETIKKRHEYYIYQCLDCGEQFWMKTAPHLRSECQYGPMMQAAALSLMNTVNSPINKVRMFLSV